MGLLSGAFCLLASAFVLLSVEVGHGLEPSIPLLKNGSKGLHVRLAQTLLKDNLGSDLVVDDDFGNRTEKAVRDFQRKHQLDVDGKIGPNTWKALRGTGDFQYDQSSGEWSRNGVVWWKGYSGSGDAKNDPKQERIKNKGPIPRGKWMILAPINSNKTGPFVLPLQPNGHDAHTRSAFQIHGDKASAPGTASSGCIILPRHIREHIAASNEKDIAVVE